MVEQNVRITVTGTGLVIGLLAVIEATLCLVLYLLFASQCKVPGCHGPVVQDGRCEYHHTMDTLDSMHLWSDERLPY